VVLSKYCKEQDIGACAIKLELTVLNIYVVIVYRAPCCNFNSFVTELDIIIKSLYKVELKLSICGDINIGYFTDTERKK
jgi:hypothetical protein